MEKQYCQSLSLNTFLISMDFTLSFKQLVSDSGQCPQKKACFAVGGKSIWWHLRILIAPHPPPTHLSLHIKHHLLFLLYCNCAINLHTGHPPRPQYHVLMLLGQWILFCVSCTLRAFTFRKSKPFLTLNRPQGEHFDFVTCPSLLFSVQARLIIVTLQAHIGHSP